MSLYLAKTANGFVPGSDEAARFHARLGEGEAVRVRLDRVRSLKFHRMYFGICRTIGRNQEPQRDESSIDAELRILAGHYDVVPLDGHPVEIRMPKRIAFDQLDAAQWAALWPSLESAISQRFGSEYVDKW